MNTVAVLSRLLPGLLPRLFPHLLPRRRLAVQKTGACAPAPAHTETETDADERLLGCGWFDSSHELNHGLLVQEHATPDTLASELPLVNWLELHLGGWRVAQPA